MQIANISMLRHPNRVRITRSVAFFCTCVAVLIVLHLWYLDRAATAPSSSTSPVQNGKASSDVELVVASMKHENTSWIREYLPDWRSSIYVVDDPGAQLTVPRNKGREAMVYLTCV